MSAEPMSVGQYFIIESQHLEQLLAALRHRGYEVIGPTVCEGAIVYQPLTSIRDLPEGWADQQQAGRYRLRRRSDGALFGYVVGPHSWKKVLYRPLRRLWRAERNTKGFRIVPEDIGGTRYALLGVRACELHAIAIQDQVFLHGKYVDQDYKVQREGLFLVAINCTEPGGNCFCASMNTGPKATTGFDLALTELLREGRHCFLVEVGTERGAEILALVPHGDASDADKEAAAQAVADAAVHMGRSLDTQGIKDLLYRNYESPQWDTVAARCLSCANCTMVCPTCFCAKVEDTTDLAGGNAERWRRWDSCFTEDFSYIHGGSVRATTKSRYRQWLTHKLASWIDQFGRSGCVGCGRCITWCPVGIDITAEVRALRENDASSPASDSSRSPHDNRNA
ncbi:MAG TPA: 4Fe-4S dicluster domain-containing protein [Terriglobales bacterium]